jgi:putative membrane protein
MRIVKLVMCGSLLMLPAFGFAADQKDTGPDIPKEVQVKVKNKGDVDATKSPLTVPERKFVERAASDHIADIELSRLALERTQNPQVRNLAQSIVDDHQKSLDQLKSIANDQKFPIPTSASTLTKKDYDRLSKLRGSDFDREYLKLMSKRHSEAMQDFQQTSNQLQNEDLRSYANQTLPTLKEHKEKAETDIKEMHQK